MAVTLNLHGIEITCDKPEEAMVLASAAASVKMPKASDIAKLVERPIKIKVNDAEMTCENPVSAASMLMAAGVLKTPKSYSTKARGAQGKGPERIWKLAAEYGEKHGITTDESRRLITQKMREYKARLALQKNNDEDKKFLTQIKGLPTGPEYLEASLSK